jgi:hypothetical protein
MKKNLTTLLGHVALAILHYYVMTHKGIDGFQIFSFIFAHAIWNNSMKRVFRIYGLK